MDTTPTTYYEKNKETMLAKMREKYYADRGKPVPATKRKAKLTPEERLEKRRARDRAKRKTPKGRAAKNLQKRRSTARKVVARQATLADHKANLHTVAITAAQRKSAKTRHSYAARLEKCEKQRAKAKLKQKEKNKLRWEAKKADPELMATHYAEKSAWYKSKTATDPTFKVGMAVRKLVKDALRRKNAAKNMRTHDYLGCSIAHAVAHITSQFEPGMRWANDAEEKWHIDHIRPLASFDTTDPEWLHKANHYTNLQPLWASENIAKGSSYQV
jgi:hypothetical protein